MKVFQVLLLLVLAVAIGIKLWSLPPNQSAFLAVNGIVVDGRTNEPLVGVRVLVVGSNSSASTRENGLYRILCEAGAHKLRFLMNGYENHDESITLNDGNMTVNVALKPSELPSLPTMKLAASPNTIFSRESNRESTITVVVKKSDGTPTAGVKVVFKCTSTYPGKEVVGRFNSQTAVTDEKGVAAVVWTCRGESAVEQLNVYNAMRFFFWVYITASSSVEDRLIEDTTSIVIQKEACHYYC